YFYWRPVFLCRQFLVSFFVLLIVSFLAIKFLNFGIAGIASILLLAVLFYLLLGIKNLIFVNRSSLYYLLSNILFFLMFFFFFLIDKSQFFLIKYLSVGLGTFFLSKEFLFFFIPDFSKRRALITAGFSFLIFELIWVISLLPIGFLNSSALTLFAALILMDFIVNHFNGALTRRVILRNATSWIILSIIIFAASNWGL
ncbi:MAG: hypothetical protein AAB516_01215, partial [Patescibacteria group bacterium]